LITSFKRKRTKEQNTMQNLKIERTTPLKTGVKSGAPEGLAVPAPMLV
jgi:hypothetical protein